MTTKSATLKRREQVSLCLSKSMTSEVLIAKQINSTVSKVHNDLYWMKKNAKKWLHGHTLDGYVFETHNTIEQLKDIELELQSLRSQEKNLDDKLKIIHELTKVMNMRWVMQGDGPTLMAAKYATEYDR